MSSRLWIVKCGRNQTVEVYALDVENVAHMRAAGAQKSCGLLLLARAVELRFDCPLRGFKPSPSGEAKG